MTQQQHAPARAVNRIDRKVTAWLVGKQDKAEENGLTADASSRGAQAISRSAWPLGEMILVSIPGFHFTAAARVACLLRVGGGRVWGWFGVCGG
jgi:hypothetical protein